MKNKKKSLVYSTDKGQHCPECAMPKAQCQCKQNTNVVIGDGIVRLMRQVKGRAGKPVVIITGLGLIHSDLKHLAKKLKSKCGVGGSIEAGNILIQGDKRELIKLELEALSYTVKNAGG